MSFASFGHLPAHFPPPAIARCPQSFGLWQPHDAGRQAPSPGCSARLHAGWGFRIFSATACILRGVANADGKMEFTLSREASVSLSMSVHRLRTDRTLDANDDSRVIIQELAHLSREELWSRRTRDLRKALRSLSKTCLGRAVFYRARSDCKDIHGWRHMGPPPAECTEDTRYSARGTAVLYLCSSETGTRLEVSGDRLCVQEYAIDFGTITVADLTNEDGLLNTLVQWAFDYAEGAKLEGMTWIDGKRWCPESYVFGQFLAENLVAAGWDGFFTPGVRGNKDCSYRNLILFHPRNGWQNWSIKGAGFHRDPPAE